MRIPVRTGRWLRGSVPAAGAHVPGVGGLPPLFGSPPPPTEALLVTDGTAAASTLTGIKIALEPPPAIGAGLAQLIAWTTVVQAQVPLVKLPGAEMPAGSVSRTMIVPEVAATLVLVTVSV